MITAARLVGVYGATATFEAGTSGDADAGGYSLNTISPSPILAGDERPNPDQSGAAETYVQNRSLILACGGMINGTSASDYVTRRNVLADALLPDSGAPTEFKHGTFYVTFAGQSEVYVDYVCLSWTAPMDLTGPFTSEYAFTLRVPFGYWRFTSGGATFKF